MNVGIYFDLRNAPPWPQDPARLYGFTLELCEEAERLGTHSVWLSEHHLFDDGYLPQPLTFAAAVAARTRRVRIGTAVLLAPLPRRGRDRRAGGSGRPRERRPRRAGARRRIPGPGVRALRGRPLASGTGSPTRGSARSARSGGEGRVTPAPVQPRLPIWLGYQGPKGAGAPDGWGRGCCRRTPRSTSHTPRACARAGTTRRRGGSESTTSVVVRAHRARADRVVPAVAVARGWLPSRRHRLHAGSG